MSSGRAAEASLFFAEALLPSGWAHNVRVTLADGEIAAVEPDAASRTDESPRLVAIPAAANLHSHAFQRGMAGLAERRGPATDSFWTWREVMYRFLGAMTPDDVEAVTAYAFMEMLETGFGRVGEFHYLHHDPEGRPYADIVEMANRIAAAAETTGIALTLLPVFYAHATFGGAPPAEGQRRFISDRDSFQRILAGSRDAIASLPRATIGVAPHSLRAITPEELAFVSGLLPEAPLHMHVAEQVKEVDDCIAWSRQRPVEWLLEHANVDGRWCLIHATHMTADETRRLALTGAVAGLCPMTEASLGDGIFNGPGWRDAGGAFGVGTDSNILVGLAAELRQLEYAQRLRQRLRNVMAHREATSTGRSLFDAALTGGAQALGVPAPVIAPGAPADIVALDASHPSLADRQGDALLDGWIFATDHGAIDKVWIGGQELVTAGRHVARDTIEARYRETMKRLL